MAGGAAAELAEALQLIDAHAGISGQVEQRIEQHRAMAGREHEAVAVGPLRARRIEFEEAAPQHRGDVGHAHGHAGMAAFRLLDRIHGECADGVGHAAEPRIARRRQRWRRGRCGRGGTHEPAATCRPRRAASTAIGRLDEARLVASPGLCR